MKKYFLLLLFSAISVTLHAVTLSQSKTALTVKNQNYTVTFDKKQNYTARVTFFGRKKASVSQALPTFYLDGELDKYDGRYNPASIRIGRKQANAKAEVLLNTPEKIQLAFDYDFYGGKVREVLTFDNSCAIKYDVHIDHTARLLRHSFEVTLNERNGNGYFLPDYKRISGNSGGNGKNIAGMNYCLAVYPDSSVLGIMPASNKNLAGLEYAMAGVKEGENSERALMRVVFNQLAQYGKKGSFDCSYYLLAAAKPETAVEFAESIIKPKDLEIFSFDIAKLVTRPGKDNSLALNIRNNSAKNIDALLKVTCFYGLDSEKVLTEKKLALKAGSRQDLTISLKFPADLKFGTAIRCELIKDGKIVDTAVDFCTVSDFAPRDSGFGVVNAGQVYKSEQVDVRNNIFKKKYIGSYEYYCWAESTIGALAPVHDSWIPNTEAPYSNVLTKKFLKHLIADAHSKGLNVFSWITGLWNFKYALQRPDRIQYTKNGEPNIYSGQVYPDGRRRAVLKANYFTPERAKEWGEEMADSIDMFGWDGCRWDYTFVPSIKCDPLYAGDTAEDWYDYRGIPQSKLYPDPDMTGKIALTAWRKAVEDRHPDFIYGTNFPSSKEKWERHPLYHQTMARRALCLFEDMLNFNSKKYNTFERWGDELALRCDMVRKYNGTCGVGAMRGLDVGGTAFHIANYTAVGAGVKWWANGRYEIEYLRDAERNRFAMRYAKYFYGTEYFRTPDAAKITGSVNVLYKPFLRQSKKADSREIVMPIVNLPEGPQFICQHHKDPAVRKNVAVAVPLTENEQIEAVYLMTPQAPEKAVKLTVKAGKFVIPEIKDAVLIVVKVKGK